MHEPRLVILDEPTAGVDFELRLELWAYIRRLHGEGTTILLTTHYLEEAEELCEEIALIRGGRLLARDSADGPARHATTPTRWPTSTSRRWRRERARRPSPRADRPQRARVAPRAEAVDADGRRADPQLVPLHPRLRAVARQPHQADRRRRRTRSSSCPASSRWRWSRPPTPTTRRRSSRRASTATSTTCSPRPMRPWEVNLGAVDRRRRARAAHRRGPAGLRDGRRRRARAPPVRARARGDAGARALLVLRRDRRHLRQLVGPHGVRARTS